MFEKIISKNPNEDSPSPQPAATTPAKPTDLSQTSTPSSTPSTGHRNVLLPDVDIKGKVRFENDLIVDGKIEGEITSSGSLTVGENARIKAEINTRTVVVYGKVHGNITVTDRIELRANAEVIGDIKAAVLTMEAGAVFVGSSTVGAPSSQNASANPKKQAAPENRKPEQKNSPDSKESNAKEQGSKPFKAAAS